MNRLGRVLAAIPLVVVATSAATSNAADPVVEIKATRVNVRLVLSEMISERAIGRLRDMMFDAPASPTFTLSLLGSGLSKSRLVEGLEDGVISGADPRAALSGTPLSDEQRDAVSAAGVDVVGIPVHAVGLAVLGSGPAGEPPGFRTETVLIVGDEQFLQAGPNDELGGQHPSLDAGTFKLPWRNLTSMVLESSSAEGLNRWDHPDIMGLWGYTLAENGSWTKGENTFTRNPPVRPAFAPRFEPSASNFYLQSAVAQQAPDVWASYFDERSQPVKPPSETYVGGSDATTRAAHVTQLEIHLANAARAYGTLVAGPAWLLRTTRAPEDRKNLKLWVVELLNGAGEWTTPTPESISLALEAGGERPLYALENEVPGAYPLTWVDSMYVPSKGLSIDETNALSAFVRLLVTDGQDEVLKDDDGVLTPALVTKALDAMNTAVTSNCAAAGGVAVDSATSPYYPPAALAPKLNALPAQAVCATKVEVAATTTTVAATTTIAATTTAPATSSTTAAATSTTRTATVTTVRASNTATSPRTTPRTTATTTATTAAATTAAPVTTAAAPAAVSTTTTMLAPSVEPVEDDTRTLDDAVPARVVLPLGLPSSGRGDLDRLTTMLMGAATLLLLRRSFVRRFRVAV